MAKPTERTDWATQGASGSGGADALRTATDTSRWTLGWQTTPSNLPGEQGEKPNLNEQNYWQYAVHQWIQYLEGATDTLLPLGGIIGVSTDLTGAFDSASGVVTDGFMLCDGTAIPGSETVSGSTPDLTDDRFLMGSTTAGTSASTNTRNLSHSHTVDSHTHTMAHTHGAGNYGAAINHTGGSTIYTQFSSSTSFTANYAVSGLTVGANSGTWSGTSVYGTSSASSAANTGSATPGTNSQLSSTQDIRPKYYTVKYFMRVS